MMASSWDWAVPERRDLQRVHGGDGRGVDHRGYMRGGGLAARHPSVVSQQDHIDEPAADIDADADSGP